MQRVSEKIKKNDIDNWSSAVPILIKAPTGSGKTYWTKNTLIPYAHKKNMSIILLVNRVTLKLQTEYDINKIAEINKTQYDNLDVMTYQHLTSLIENKQQIQHYDIIVQDEIQFFFNDSQFNYRTDISFEYLLKQDSIKIYMSATAELIEEYLSQIKMPIKKYYIEPDYDNFLFQILYYWKDDAIKKFLLNLPPNDKVLFFTSKNKGKKLSTQFQNSKFLCAKDKVIPNTKSKRKKDKTEMQNIIENGKFECQILFATSFIDCGVNFIDSQLKYIIIDSYTDYSELIQMCGRKRIKRDNMNKPEEKFTLILKAHTQKELTDLCKQEERRIEQADYLLEHGKSEYANKYGRNIKRVVFAKDNNGLIDFKVNQMMYYKAKSLIEQYKTVGTYNGYIEEFVKLINYHGAVFNIENLHDKPIIEEYLFKLVGIKLFNKEQENLKKFICLNDTLFNPLLKKSQTLKLNILNAYLLDNEIPFVINSKKETKKQNRDKHYWIIGRVDYGKQNSKSPDNVSYIRGYKEYGA